MKNEKRKMKNVRKTTEKHGDVNHGGHGVLDTKIIFTLRETPCSTSCNSVVKFFIYEIWI